ncbi:hypothetical protein JYU19_01960 [bacterium AH-315-J21]|nr:hypothetical protein [bacterium AH-315-J21]
MPRKKENEEFVETGAKDIWNPFALQSLAPERFGSVAALILSGKHNLLSFANRRTPRSTLRSF